MLKIEFVWIRNYETLREILPHSHNCYELVYYLAGDGMLFCNGRKYEYSSSTCVLISPNETHGEVHKSLTKMIAVGFSAQNLPYEVNDIITKDQDGVIFNLVQKIRSEFKTKLPYFEEVLKSRLNEILVLLSRENKKETNSADIPSGTIEYSLKYIQEYFSTDITVEQLAKSAGYSPEHFRILFKKKTGIAPKTMIDNLRLEKSKHLLLHTDLSLDEIGTNCGFEYYSHFSLFFTKKTGVNPSIYRKQS